jgi:hypothetical protein
LKEVFITLPEYPEGTKFKFGISPAQLCNHLCDNTVSPKQVYTVLSNTHNNYLVQLQGIMKERFDRLDFEPAHEPQIITYANLHQQPSSEAHRQYYLLDQLCRLGPSTPGSGASSSMFLPIHQTRQTYQRFLLTRRMPHSQLPCPHSASRTLHARK